MGTRDNEGRRKKIRLLLLFFLFLLIGYLISGKINLQPADLGRHLKNGEEIISCLASEIKTASKGVAFRGGFQNCEVLTKNYYSYTYPDYPFLNHHWGSGVIFYLIAKFAGFQGLSVFYIFAGLTAFWFFFDIARKKSSFSIAFLCALFLLPLITHRREIRPEIFSYLFCGIFWWILEKNKLKKKEAERGKIGTRLIYILPLLMLLWVNLHVYFFLGLFILGIFILDKIINKDPKDIKSLLIVFVLTVLACLINPAGIKGALYPLNIFNNYGYQVFENQTVFYIDRVIGNYPPNLYFKLGFIFLIGSWFFPIKAKKIPTVNLILTIFISYLGWTAVRNFTIFGLFCLPLISYNFNLGANILAGSQGESLRDFKKYFLTSLAAVFIIFILFFSNIKYWLDRKAGLGLKENNSKPADFFIQNNLKGPIFNNYDIGGYLIYYLFPQEKVFVDNRPEAYPIESFTSEYVPMQENNDLWEVENVKFGFNLIFFSKYDLTPWAQNFLAERKKDKNWALVYDDNQAVIFLKRNKGNEELIKKFELK